MRIYQARHFSVGMLAATLAVPLHVQAMTPRELIGAAIHDGLAEGVIDGELSAEVRRRLNATGPLIVSVKRLYEMQQIGCARLRIDFKQGQALLPGHAAPSDYSWTTDVSLCADGTAPTNARRRLP